MSRPAAGKAMRWKLELIGTAPTNCRELEAAVDEVGWTRLQTRTEARLGVTRVFIVTDPGESAEHIATELAEHMTVRLPTIARLEPTTWEAVGARLRATADGRHKLARSRAVVPS